METDLYQEFLKYKFQPECQQDLERIYNIACKSVFFETTTVQCTNMKQMEWVQLIMERGLIKNNYGVKFFTDNYNIALQEDIQEPKQQEKIIKKNENKFEAQKKQLEEQKAKEAMKDKFHRWRFFYLVFLIAKKMFKGHKKPVEEFLNLLFKDVNSSAIKRKMYDGLIPVIRQIKYDEYANRLLGQQALKAFNEFQRDLQLAFSIYISENYEYIQKYGTPMLTWEEIAMLNKSMSIPAFIRLLHESRILPKFISIESIQEALIRFIPAVTIKENGFYGSNKPIEIYEQDILKNSVNKEYDGDPQVSMFEFQMVLGKIALDLFSKEKENLQLKKDDYTPIENFLTKVLHIRPDSDQTLDYLMQNDSPFCNLLIQQHKDRIVKKSQSMKDNNVDDFLTISPDQLLIREQEEQKFRSEEKANINYKQVIQQLKEELPELPQKYQVKQENPPKQYTNPEDEIPWKDRIKDFILIGEQPPKPPPEKGMGNKQKEKKEKNKSTIGAIDFSDRQIIWEDRFKPVPKSSLDHLRDYNNQIEFNEADLNDITRGTMSQIQVLPVLIDELLYPTNCPVQAQKYLEASFLSFHEKDYTMAYKNMDLCYDLWLSKEEDTLIQENILFFEVYKGMIYQSAGRDDMAIKCYLQSKTFGDKLPFSPDKAIPYACLGNILYRMQEYEMACRCFLKARECRELTIGADTVEVATIFNNLGCCMALMERNKEAQTYYQFSHAIFDLEIGPLHQRTLTVLRNLQKLKYAYIDYTPPYKRLWYSYEKDPFGNTKVTKATKKKA